MRRWRRRRRRVGVRWRAAEAVSCSRPSALDAVVAHLKGVMVRLLVELHGCCWPAGWGADVERCGAEQGAYAASGFTEQLKPMLYEF